MAIQERNSEMISLLSADFIKKTDTVYLSGIVAGGILMLPGLVAFWPMSITQNDATWDLGGYTATAPAATGYVTGVFDGTTYKFLVSNA